MLKSRLAQLLLASFVLTFPLFTNPVDAQDSVPKNVKKECFQEGGKVGCAQIRGGKLYLEFFSGEKATYQNGVSNGVGRENGHPRYCFSAGPKDKPFARVTVQDGIRISAYNWVAAC